MSYNASQYKSPVCYNLDESDWEAVVDCYRFVFSTMAHRDKFLNEVDKKIQWLNHSMSKRFHLPCMFNDLAMIQLYMQIEGRGFRVYDENEGVVYRSPQEMTVYAGLCYNVEGVENGTR